MRHWDYINLVITTLGLQSYLEIGYGSGENFWKINCRNKFAVDNAIIGNPFVAPETSHEFLNWCVESDTKFDCIFIDGDHEFDVVDKDIELGLKCLNPNGALITQGVSPPNEWSCRPRSEYKGGEWVGGVWKAFVGARVKNALESFAFPQDYGIGVIINNKAAKLKLKPEYTFEWLHDNRMEALGMITPSVFVEKHTATTIEDIAGNDVIIEQPKVGVSK